jgi:hypothetical protein
VRAETDASPKVTMAFERIGCHGNSGSNGSITSKANQNDATKRPAPTTIFNTRDLEPDIALARVQTVDCAQGGASPSQISSLAKRPSDLLLQRFE